MGQWGVGGGEERQQESTKVVFLVKNGRYSTKCIQSVQSLMCLTPD